MHPSSLTYGVGIYETRQRNSPAAGFANPFGALAPKFRDGSAGAEPHLDLGSFQPLGHDLRVGEGRGNGLADA